MKTLMLGNEAVARGLYEAGCSFVSSYPGTPSTEITECAAKYPEIYAEWAPNEKVAMEAAFGACLAGKRSFCGMKHVGLNVAADPLFTISYTGVNAGMIIAVADDAGMHSSQNEQDSRHYAMAAKIPMLEPADSAEGLEFAKLAYELSEKFDTPVLLKMCTRVAHSQSVVEPGERVEAPEKPYEKNGPKYIMMPGNAKRRHPIVEERTNALIAYAETSPLNRVEEGSDHKIGIITSSTSYQYVKEVCGDRFPVLKLGMIWPMPEKLIKDFAAGVEQLVVVEELDGFIEAHCRNLGLSPMGKDTFSCIDELNQNIVAEKLGIPVVTGWNSQDCIYDEHPLYIGRAGNMGDRPGNFAVQNSDLVLSLGSRLSIRQVGYNYPTWAREAYVIYNDIDAEELKKPTVHVDMPVHADVRDLLEKMEMVLEVEAVSADGGPKDKEAVDWWISRCQQWKEKYPVVLPKHYEAGEDQPANIYAAIKEISRRAEEDQITVVGNGSPCVVGGHAYEMKKGQRFISNSAIASMGYDLPAAIGACLADHTKDIILVTGDGSIQMNLQELQTIIHNHLPIKIFLINNQGYHSIRQTQKTHFHEPLVGIGVDSGDLSFPSMEKLAWAYGYPYVAAHHNSQLGEAVEQTLATDGPVICEIFVDMEQNFEPKAAAKMLPDGTMVSVPLEDLAPFLPEEELAENMIIPMIKPQ